MTSTQSQALSAIQFLYQEMRGREFYWLDDVSRAKTPQPLSTLLMTAADDPEMALIVRLL